MTTVDYVLIAASIRTARREVRPFINADVKNSAIDTVTESLCHTLKQDNDRFDEMKFRNACRLED